MTALADLVQLMEISGREWLFYEAFPSNVAIIRGTTADLEGNITIEREALILDNLAIAMAAKACKGSVIAQVERAPSARRVQLLRGISVSGPGCPDPREVPGAVRRAADPTGLLGPAHRRLAHPELAGELAITGHALDATAWKSRSKHLISVDFCA
jgi:Coenzyme A transferase